MKYIKTIYKIENIEKYINPETIVSYTTIEPPIFAGHERPGKIIKDLGIDLDKLIDEKEKELANSGIEDKLKLMFKDKI